MTAAAASYLPYLLYAVPLAALFLWAVRRREQLEAVSAGTHAEAVEAGLTQPPSLHPVIDTVKCIGCESCVHACPEFPAHQVLGIVADKAMLVSPTDCIGHGACKLVCPTGAISLVFGTAERGVDLPAVNADFSTNVEGIYIAGELGGMGLIRNAIEQGRQAIEAVAAEVSSVRTKRDDCLDVLIVGAGPAGIAATLGAMARKLRHRTIEQHAFGGTVANFPRGKIVMTAPVELPLVGKVTFRETTKEKLVGFWERVRKETRMPISYGERLLGIERTSDGLVVKTSADTYRTRTVLLAIGRRGTPRRLGVAGENLPKVSYSLSDPAEYRGQKVLVVGGGDSALEAACTIAEEASDAVTLSYRSAAFTRAKKKNRLRVEALAKERRLKVLLESNVQKIEENNVVIEQSGTAQRVPNDAVIICAGGILPDGLLKEIGINIETKHGTA
ncbi:MAG: NAD(P)-binding domain-containing protein [Gammaproteobacteria bacterium]